MALKVAAGFSYLTAAIRASLEPTAMRTADLLAKAIAILSDCSDSHSRRALVYS